MELIAYNLKFTSIQIELKRDRTGILVFNFIVILPLISMYTSYHHFIQRTFFGAFLCHHFILTFSELPILVFCCISRVSTLATQNSFAHRIKWNVTIQLAISRDVNAHYMSILLSLFLYYRFISLCVKVSYFGENVHSYHASVTWIFLIAFRFAPKIVYIHVDENLLLRTMTKVIFLTQIFFLSCDFDIGKQTFEQFQMTLWTKLNYV